MAVRIPADRIVPALRRHFADNDPECFYYHQDVRPYGEYGVEFAKRVQADPSTIAKLFSGRVRSVGFDLTDRMLAEMGLTELWMTDPVLNAIYESVDLSRARV